MPGLAGPGKPREKRTASGRHLKTVPNAEAWLGLRDARIAWR